jgi:opacity protein-like surface antigen
MKRHLILASVLAAALSAWSPAAMAFDWDGFYAKVYGGVGPSSDTVWGSYSEDYRLAASRVWGAAFGLATPVEGLSIEVDVLLNSREYTDENDVAVGTYLHTASLMVNSVFTLPVTDVFSLYAGAGIGVIKATYDVDDPGNLQNGDGVGAGGQVFAGINLQVTENVSIFGEGRYQAPLNPITYTNGYGDDRDLEFGTAVVMFGIKLST